MPLFRKKPKSLARKARVAVATGIIAGALLGGFKHAPKPYVPPMPIPREELKGHEREPGVAFFFARDDYKGSIGPFFRTKPDTFSFFKSNLSRSFHDWVMKHRKKEWQKYVKQVVGNKDYIEAISRLPERDTDWLTEEQAMKLYAKLMEYQKLWSKDLYKGFKRTPEGYKKALANQRDYYGNPVVDTTGLLVFPDSTKPSGFDTLRVDRVNRRLLQRKRLKDFKRRRMQR